MSGRRIRGAGLVFTPRPPSVSAPPNLLPQPLNLGNDEWFRVRANVVGGQSDPFGGTGAFQVVANATGALGVWIVDTENLAIGTPYTFSAFVKVPAGQTNVRMTAFQGTDHTIIFNLVDKTVVFNRATINPTLVELSDGWFRMGFSFISTISTGTQLQIRRDGQIDSGTAAIIAYGARLEPGYVMSALASAQPSSSTPAPVNNGLRFDGSTNFIDLTTALIPASANFDFSVDFYLRGTSAGLRPLLSAGLPYQMVAGVDLARLIVANGPSDLFSGPLAADTWHTYRVTRTGNVYDLLINGTSVATLDRVSTWASVTQRIGRNAADFFFTGSMRNLRLSTGSETNIFLMNEGTGTTLANTGNQTRTLTVSGTNTAIWTGP